MRKTLVMLFTLGLFGCNSNENTFYIKTDHARELKKFSKVYCKGMEIGNIADISLLADSVLIELSVHKEFDMSKNAEILLYNPDLWTKTLEIKNFGKDKGIHHPGDTIHTVLNYETIVIDSLD